MSYLVHDRKKKVGVALVLKMTSFFIFLALVMYLFGGRLTQGIHYVQHGVAYMLGYYEDPARPIAENAYVKSLQDENDQLKQLLGRQPEKDDREFAVVLVRPPKSPYDSLTVDLGEDHGVMPGDLVYGDMDYLIGEVDSSYPSTAVVKLYSSPGQKIDVRISSSTTSVVAEGRGNGNFYIKVPKNISVAEGDPIVAPGFHNTIIGVAEKVDGGAGEAYSSIYFKLPVNLNSLRYVEIKKVIH